MNKAIGAIVVLLFTMFLGGCRTGTVQKLVDSQNTGQNIVYTIEMVRQCLLNNQDSTDSNKAAWDKACNTIGRMSVLSAEVLQRIVREIHLKEIQ